MRPGRRFVRTGRPSRGRRARRDACRGPNPRPIGAAPAPPAAAPRPCRSANRSTLRRSAGSGVRSRIPPATSLASRSDRMLRAIPRPAWNSSKCWRPLSAPRRIRNAHFSPISSTAAGSGQRSAASLNASMSDVTFCVHQRHLSPRIASKHKRAAKNSCELKLYLVISFNRNANRRYRDVPSHSSPLPPLALAAAPAAAATYSAKLGRPADRAHHCPRHHLELRPGRLPGRDRREPPAVLCQSLAKRAGRLESFVVDGRAFSSGRARPAATRVAKAARRPALADR